MYSTATLSGKALRCGNVLSISVNTLDIGWEYVLSCELSNDETLGYGGPTNCREDAPSAAFCRRLDRKSSRIPSMGHVGCRFLMITLLAGMNSTDLGSDDDGPRKANPLISFDC